MSRCTISNADRWRGTCVRVSARVIGKKCDFMVIRTVDIYISFGINGGEEIAPEIIGVFCVCGNLRGSERRIARGGILSC